MSSRVSGARGKTPHNRHKGDKIMSWEGDILKKFRKERKLTQAQFAEWLEIPKRTYEKWENGGSVPPIWVIKLIRFKCEKSTQGEQINIDTLYRTYVKYDNDERLLHSMDFRGNEIERLESWKRNLFEKNIPVGIVKTYKLIKEERIK